jgi:opacity protein-like surface antigen
MVLLSPWLIAGAAAADMPPVKAPSHAAPIVAYDWSGLYIGGVAGVANVGTEFTDTNENFSLGYWKNGGFSAAGGGTAGYNWQKGNLVLGVEADISALGYDKGIDNPVVFTRWNSQWNWMATIRGRVGLAVDRALFFATGGVAIVNQKQHIFYPDLADDEFDCGCVIDTQKTQVGLAAGAGAEYAFGNNWSVKAEYLYVTLPTKQIQDTLNPITDNRYQFSSNAQFLRLGLNYRFADGQIPGHPARATAFVPAVTYDWSGIYIGGVIGAGNLSSILTDYGEDVSAGTLDNTGWTISGGGTLGVNWQAGAMVFGVEGDISWLNYDKTVLHPDFDGKFDSQWNWMATIRGRIGLAAGRALVYATGGAAIIDARDHPFILPIPFVTNHTADGEFKGTRLGLVAGAGAEYAFADNWTLKAEYLYVTTPTKEVPETVSDFDGGFQVSSNAHFLRLGVNYKFGGGPLAPVQTASAAAMPVKARRPLGELAPTYNWTGLYIGGVAGAGNLATQTRDYDEGISLGYWQNSGWTFAGGGTAGVNWQKDAAVFGIEADISWLSYDKTVDMAGLYTSRFDSKWNWLATVRGRMGVAFDRTLVYATGGLAIADVHHHLVELTDPFVGGDFDRTQIGLVAGAGAEYAFADNWTFKAEYLYVTLPGQEVHDTVNPAPNAIFQFASDAHFVRAGLNYKFGVSPVVAKY